MLARRFDRGRAHPGTFEFSEQGPAFMEHGTSFFEQGPAYSLDGKSRNVFSCRPPWSCVEYLSAALGACHRFQIGCTVRQMRRDPDRAGRMEQESVAGTTSRQRRLQGQRRSQGHGPVVEFQILALFWSTLPRAIPVAYVIPRIHPRMNVCNMALFCQTKKYSLASYSTFAFRE